MMLEGHVQEYRKILSKISDLLVHRNIIVTNEKKSHPDEICIEEHLRGNKEYIAVIKKITYWQHQFHCIVTY